MKYFSRLPANLEKRPNRVYILSFKHSYRPIGARVVSQLLYKTWQKHACTADVFYFIDFFFISWKWQQKIFNSRHPLVLTKFAFNSTNSTNICNSNESNPCSRLIPPVKPSLSCCLRLNIYIFNFRTTFTWTKKMKQIFKGSC